MELSQRTGRKGLAIGLDFSGGMLKVSRDKTVAHPNICLLQADAAELPFTSGSFDAVTCTHAFYELKGSLQEKALREIVRVLKPGKAFFMVERDLPENAFIRILYYLRLASMGLNKAKQILKNETDTLGRHFNTVEKITVPPEDPKYCGATFESRSGLQLPMPSQLKSAFFQLAQRRQFLDFAAAASRNTALG